MRVLVTGSNGLLGTKLLELLLSLPNVQPLGASRQSCANGYLGAFPFWQVDLTQREAVERLLDEAVPEVVIHTAAMTDVDGCEREPERAWRENVEATEYVARAAHARRARLVHISTEYVFDGLAGPYGEDDAPHPLGLYGRSKLASEAVVSEQAPGSAIARTTVVFGYAPHVRPNFVTGLVTQMKGGRGVRVVDDQIGTPTLADNLAQMVWALASTPAAQGVFNTVGATLLDRYRFALLVAGAFSLDPSLVSRTDTASLGQLAPRPLRAGLRMDRFRATFPAVPVLPVVDALEVVRRQIQAHEVRELVAAGERT